MSRYFTPAVLHELKVAAVLFVCGTLAGLVMGLAARTFGAQP